MSSPTLIANIFLRLNTEDSESESLCQDYLLPVLSPAKLTALVYFAQGWSLALNKERLFEEMPAVSQNGLTYSSLGIALQPFRKRAQGIASDYRIPAAESESSLSLEQHAYLSFVWQAYREYSGAELMKTITRRGTPWAAAKAAGLSYLKEQQIYAYFQFLSTVQINPSAIENQNIYLEY